MNMESAIKLYKDLEKLELRKPYMLAAGPGTANVGFTTVSYLKDKLGAELLGEIEPRDFFSPPYTLLIQDGVVKLRSIELEEKPENKLYYWRSGKANDLIFFVGNTQPLPGKGPELASEVLNLAKVLKVKRLYIPGAFVTDMHHKSEPVVSGVVSKKKLLASLREYNIGIAPPMNIAFNLNTWLLGAAKREKIDAICLASEIPFYTAEEPNPRAYKALVKVLSKMLDIEDKIDLAELDRLINSAEKGISERIEELRGLPDEESKSFLRYLDLLEKRREETEKEAMRRLIEQSAFYAKPKELPESLRYIEELYRQAKKDKSKVSELKAELDRITESERLEIFRKYGDELLNLFRKII